LKMIAYALIAVVMTVISVLGHANMVAFSKLMVPTAGLMMLIGIFVFLPNFDPSYAGGDYALGSFWPTWALGAIIVAATTNSYGPYLGDWTRHIPEGTKAKKLMAVSWIGGFVGMGSAYVFGAYTAVSFANPTASYASELVANSPFWYLFPLLFIGIVAGTAQAVINIYSMGLDFSAMIPKLSRIQATVLLACVSTLLVYFGAIYSNVQDLVNASLGFLVVLGAPWVIINILGFVNRRGYYYPADLQVFNHRQTGGRYWFSNGLNHEAIWAWAIGAFTGLLFTNTGLFVGPGAKLVAEIDLGLIVSILVAGSIYLTMLYIKPESKDVYGPNGSFLSKKVSKMEYVLVNSDNQIKKKA